MCADGDGCEIILGHLKGHRPGANHHLVEFAAQM
jgi:hypothetical protein